MTFTGHLNGFLVAKIVTIDYEIATVFRFIVDVLVLQAFINLKRLILNLTSYFNPVTVTILSFI